MAVAGVIGTLCLLLPVVLVVVAAGLAILALRLQVVQARLAKVHQGDLEMKEDLLLMADLAAAAALVRLVDIQRRAKRVMEEMALYLGLQVLPLHVVVVAVVAVAPNMLLR
jgi:hypothetical protein